MPIKSVTPIVTKIITPIYHNEEDLTFLFEKTMDINNNLIAKEIVGWHHGEPHENSIDYFGKLKTRYI